MNNILSFDQLYEYSKNAPIPELHQKEKLGIILLGLPGSGKSTFAKNVIIPVNRNVKTFSTDDVSLRFTKDPNKYHPSSAYLNLKYLKNYTISGQNFIFDTTGANDKAVLDIYQASKENNYDLIYILLLTDLQTAKDRNIERGEAGGHEVDSEYIDYVYSMQRQTTKDYIKSTKPKAFYIVSNTNGKYKYFKHTGDDILKRKVDKYVPMNKGPRNSG